MNIFPFIPLARSGGSLLWRTLLSASLFLLLAACGQDSERRLIDKYLSFYYPTTGSYVYEISFDWGSYLIQTGPDDEAELHPDSERYRAYIVMRPQIAGAVPDRPPAIYLTTPEGVVWTRPDSDSIPMLSERVETVTSSASSSTSVSETTIRSFSEPVIDDFLANPDLWQHYTDLK